MNRIITNVAIGLVWTLGPVAAQAIPIESSLGITTDAEYTSSPGVVTAGPVEDPQSVSQLDTLNSLNVNSSVLLNEPNAYGSAGVFGEASASWVDANAGSFSFDVGWDIVCTNPGSCDRAGVSISEGWSYTFTADATGVFTLDYLWDASSTAGSTGVFGMPDFGFWFTDSGAEFFGDATNTSTSASGSGAFTRDVVAGQTYTASVSLLSDLGTNFSRATTMVAEFNWAAPTSVPEPSALALMGVGLAGIGFARRRRTPA